MSSRFLTFDVRRLVAALLIAVAPVFAASPDAFATERPRDPAAELAPGEATSTTDRPADGSAGATSAARRAAGAIDLSPYAGSVVYVDFWASWCVPCRASFPWMNALQAELEEDGLVIIGVNTGDTPDEAARFLERVPASFTLLEDEDGAIARAYGLQGMPMAFVHDREGTLVGSHVGFNERTAEERAAELRAFVRRGK